MYTLYTCQHPQSINRGLGRLALLQNIYPSALLSIVIHATLPKARSARYAENNIESRPITSRPLPPRLNNEAVRLNNEAVSHKKTRASLGIILTDHNLRCPHEETLGPLLPTERAAKPGQMFMLI